MKRIYPVIFSIVFWGISIIPILKTDVSLSTIENSFYGRYMLIQDFNNLRLHLGDRVFPNVLVGKQGWLFYTANGEMNEYQGTNPYTFRELFDLRVKFDALDAQLRQKGAYLVLVFGPDKNSIYPQYLPDEITRIGNQSRLNQFVYYMNKYGKTPVIDLRPDLIVASKTEQVYYKTDTHWNPSAQYITYAKILSVLSQKYPELVPHPLSDFEKVDKGLTTFGLPYIMGTPNIQEDGWMLQPTFNTGVNFDEITLENGTIVRTATNQNKDLPSILIYHDSFLVGVLPFLEPHFSQTTSLPSSPYPDVWSFKWVDQVHPNIVIFESVERYINSGLYLPFNP